MHSGSGGFALVVMGVSGSGKSTLGRALAARLGLPFVEGDDLHPRRQYCAHVVRDSLSDEDRWPWLDAVARALAAKTAEAGGVVASCSALKRAYRDRIRAGAGVTVTFIDLEPDAETLRRRLAARHGHFMPASLLDSQLATLEPTAPDEDAMVLKGDAAPEAQVGGGVGAAAVGGPEPDGTALSAATEAPNAGSTLSRSTPGRGLL